MLQCFSAAQSCTLSMPDLSYPFLKLLFLALLSLFLFSCDSCKLHVDVIRLALYFHSYWQKQKQVEFWWIFNLSGFKFGGGGGKQQYLLPLQKERLSHQHRWFGMIFHLWETWFEVLWGGYRCTAQKIMTQISFAAVVELWYMAPQWFGSIWE